MNPKIYIILTIIVLMAQVSAQTINISSLSQDEKIAQMIMVRGDSYTEEIVNMKIGGVFIDRQKNNKDYVNLISKYQNNSEINLFFSTDLEGYWNPFYFYTSKIAGEITSTKEAHTLGKEHGKILREMGFNINFAPITESKNTVWPGRSFTGSEREIEEKISGYIEGIQSENISATAKHYPGGSMLKDPHIFKVRAEITSEDLSFFQKAIDANVSAIMVGHAIVTGAINSKKRQSTVSKEVISNLRKSFNGIIITDAVQMMGLKWSYIFKPSRLYPDLIKAGNDIILDTSKFSERKTRKNIERVKKSIDDGEISKDQIDSSVERILKLKGYKIAH